MLDGPRHDIDQKIFLGIETAFRIVRQFYGPKSCSVPSSFLENRGYCLLARLSLRDPYENLGVYFVKSMAKQIQDRHKDGVITGVILLYTLVREGLAALQKGITRYSLCLALKKVAKWVSDELQKQAFAVKDVAKVRGIVFSSLPNSHVADSIAHAFALVGKNGHFTLSSEETSVRVFSGLKVDKGYVSPYFMRRQTERTVYLHQARVFITNRKIANLFSLLPVIRQATENHDPLVIVCQNACPNVLASLVVNKLEGLLHTAVVCFKDAPSSLYEDLALFTGTTVFTEPLSPNVSRPYYAALGFCHAMEISQHQTLWIQKEPVSKAFLLKIRQLEEAIEATGEEQRQELVERKRQLQSLVALIPAQEDSKALYSLALTTLCSALQYGYVLGGGSALFYAAQTPTSEDAIEQEAIRIVQQTCQAPIEILANNAGIDEGAVIDKLRALSPSSLGINSNSKQIEDLVVAGILDPLTRTEGAWTSAVETALEILSAVTVIGPVESQRTS